MKYPKRSQYKYAKSRYRVRNWTEYETGLQRRSDLTVWLSDTALDAWRAPPSGKPGGQRTDHTTLSRRLSSDSMSWLLPTSPTQAVGANQYGWVHQSEFYDTSGDSTLVPAVEIGSYTWDGTTFTTEPDDTWKFSPAGGTLNGMVLQLHQGGLDYAFVEVPFLPGTLGARGRGRTMRVVPERSEPGTGPP